jgi:anti-sigma factor RsiW
MLLQRDRRDHRDPHRYCDVDFGPGARALKTDSDRARHGDVLNCASGHTAVHSYFDGELDAMRCADFERHLENCFRCRAELERLESLRELLRESHLYEHASPWLRQRVRQQLLAAVADEHTAALRMRRWFLAPAFGVLLGTAVVLTVALFVVQPHRPSIQLAAELVDAHVRSLQPGHLTDVQSTDQHTVKPWFDGRLDFVPPVADFSAQGFLLIGGRLDVIDGHNVAALVYSHRKHVINLFAWPARGNEKLAENSGSRQGYNWTRWQFGDMLYCLVSDASPTDLHDFREQIR